MDETEEPVTEEPAANNEEANESTESLENAPKAPTMFCKAQKKKYQTYPKGLEIERMLLQTSQQGEAEKSTATNVGTSV